MKKAIVASLFLCLGISNLNAQVTFKPGVRGGLNLSTITQTEGTYRPDFYLGVFGAINFTKVYTLQPEINYSRQGVNDILLYDYNSNSNEYYLKNDDISVNYISLSAMNKFTIANRFQIMVGPTLDFVVGKDSEYIYSDADLAVNFGLGYKFPNGISVEARFKKGIAEVLYNNYYYNDNDNYFWGDWNTNNVFQLGVSYAFNLKSKNK
ncbi:outer membrane beta-barrel protein [Flavobacterium macacae]|uniref:PorT family protein n=1 Tax=Flavobacterium macacae TaxID=2488993 RepID=A0A3P3WFR4_9FLAO|nr:outer membrane beta-barrel protein [Flavobacterium macacae]RRJ94001.1 PorT family protein [Flavobacterium macacae]